MGGPSWDCRKKKEKLVRIEMSSFNVLSLRSVWTPGGHQVDSGKRVGARWGLGEAPGKGANLGIGSLSAIS